MRRNSSSKNLVLIHFHPLEMYPPVLNILNYFTENLKDYKITVFTTKNKLNLEPFSPSGINIYRISGVKRRESILKRLLKYLTFNLYFLIKTFTIKPGIIIYFETLSSFPALGYYKLAVKKPKILVHYHEYNTVDELKSSMLLNRFFYKLEKHMFPIFNWISHTNKTRLELFLKDNPNVNPDCARILPNYPPSAWKTIKRETIVKNNVKRFIYIGAVSMETMYFKEFFAWIAKNNDKYTFDIYSHHVPQDVIEFLKLLNCPFIHIKEALPYEQIPFTLKEYDVGVILYKGHILNYVYNAPNKLFEYMASGLDVWFPEEMLGMNEYVTNHSYPKVLKIDFQNLESLNTDSALSSAGLKKKESVYYYETILPLLDKELKG